MSQFSMRNGLLELGMLLSGCINTVSKKAQNSSSAAGWKGIVHSFTHPWFQTLIMFIGEALCMITFIVQTRVVNRRKDAAQVQVATQTAKQLFHPIFLIPTALDLLGTSFGGIGLVYCTASVWQMMRGAIIVFTGILSFFFLKRKMLPYRWIAIGVTVCGLVLVGLSGMLAPTSVEGSDADGSTTWQVAIGILLILAGQLVGAIQMVVEEMFLKNRNFAPLHIVGMEGIFGSLLMAFVILPLLYVIPGDSPSAMPKNSYDDSVDAVLQIVHNGALAGFCLLYLCSIAFYNFFGLSVTKYLTCVHRTLIDACRTVFVWLWQIMTYYCIDKRFGEPWTKYSPIQLGGFALLLCGTVLYNGLVRLPYLQYEQPAAAPPKVLEATPSAPADKVDDITAPLLDKKEEGKP